MWSVAGLVCARMGTTTGNPAGRTVTNRASGDIDAARTARSMHAMTNMPEVHSGYANDSMARAAPSNSTTHVPMHGFGVPTTVGARPAYAVQSPERSVCMGTLAGPSSY